MPVHCHADGLGNDTLYAAARGCTKITFSPAGDVESIGIAGQVVYFHKLLTEELHVTVDFLQVGRFKGAEESFTRDGPSDAARASLVGALGDIRSAWLDGVKKGRAKDGRRGAPPRTVRTRRTPPRRGDSSTMWGTRTKYSTP